MTNQAMLLSVLLQLKYVIYVEFYAGRNIYEAKTLAGFLKGELIRMMLINNSSPKSGDDDVDTETTRDEEQGEASEPDAPTGGEENAGMSTILDGEPGTGVQNDAADE